MPASLLFSVRKEHLHGQTPSDLKLQIRAEQALTSPLDWTLRRPSPRMRLDHLKSTPPALTGEAFHCYSSENSDERCSGVDVSLKFTAKVDATGTGTKFVAMNITTNGDNVSDNTGNVRYCNTYFRSS